MEAPENIGSALKSIISRYGELKTSPATLIDAEGEELNFNKVDTALKSVGVSMHDANGQFRAFDDVIMDLAKTWQTLDRNSQRYIATVMAGNRQQSRFIALVSDYERLSELTEEAANAQDAGTLQYLKTLDSIESKMNQLQVAFQEFYTSMGLEDLFKGALDGLTDFITHLNSLPKIFDTIPITAIGMGINLVSAIKNILTLLSVPIAQAFSRLKASIGEITGASYKLTFGVNQTESVKNAEKTAEAMRAKAQETLDKKSLTFSSSETEEGVQNVPEATESVLKKFWNNRALRTVIGASVKTVGALASTALLTRTDSGTNMDTSGKEWSKILSGGAGTLGNIIGGALTGGLPGLLLGLAQSIPNIITFVDGLKATSKEVVVQLDKEIQEQKNKIIVQKDEVVSLEAAAKKLEELREHQYDSIEANQEYIDYMNQLGDSHSELISRLDEEGNSVVELKDIYRQLIKSRSELSQVELKQQELELRRALVQKKESDYLLNLNGQDFYELYGLPNWSGSQRSDFINNFSGNYNATEDYGYSTLAFLDLKKIPLEELPKYASMIEAAVATSMESSLWADITGRSDEQTKQIKQNFKANNYGNLTNEADYNEFIEAIESEQNYLQMFVNNAQILTDKEKELAEVNKALRAVNLQVDSWSTKQSENITSEAQLKQLNQFQTSSIVNLIAGQLDGLEGLDLNTQEGKAEADKILQPLLKAYKDNGTQWEQEYANYYTQMFTHTDEEIETFIKSLSSQKYGTELVGIYQKKYDDNISDFNENYSNRIDAFFEQYNKQLQLTQADKNNIPIQQFASNQWDSLITELYDGVGAYVEQGLYTQARQYYDNYISLLSTISSKSLDSATSNAILNLIKSQDLTDYDSVVQLIASIESYDAANTDVDLSDVIEQLKLVKQSLDYNINTLKENYITALGSFVKNADTLAKETTKGLEYEDLASSLAKIQTLEAGKNLEFTDVFTFDKEAGAYVYTLQGFLLAQQQSVEEINKKTQEDTARIEARIQELGKLDTEATGIKTFFQSNELSSETKNEDIVDALNNSQFADNSAVKTIVEQAIASGVYTYDNFVIWLQEQIQENNKLLQWLPEQEQLALQQTFSNLRNSLLNSIDWSKIIFNLPSSENQRALESILAASLPEGTSEDFIFALAQEYMDMFRLGGEKAQLYYQRLLQQTGAQYDYNVDKQLFEGPFINAASTISDLLNTQIGDVVSEEVNALLVAAGASGFNAEKLGVINSVEQLNDAVITLWDSIKNSNISLAEKNRDYAAILEGQAKDTETSLDIIKSSFNLSYEQMANYATLIGETLDDVIGRDIQKDDWGNYFLTNIGAEKLRNRSSEDLSKYELTDVIKERNDAYIESEIKLSSILTDEINALIAAKPGEKVNVTYLNQLLDSVSSDILGVTGENIFQLTNNIIQEAQQKGLLLQSDIDALGDALDELLNTYTSLISNGISGSLSRSDATQLQNFATTLRPDLQLDFNKTKDGLKLSRDSAIQLYAELKKVDNLAAQIVLDNFADDLTKTDASLNNISTTMARIHELEGQNTDAAKAELAVYQDLLQVQRQRADSYSFMDNALPEGMQAPENYWNAVGEAYKVMNESATSGYMEVQDFYNIVNEMNNLAKISGNTLEFMGHELSGKAVDAAGLIEWAMQALSNIDGEGVKLDLSQLGLNLVNGADSMATGFDDAIHTMADSQIKMLDAEIALLEAVVAMEDLGDIEIDEETGIGSVFEKVGGVWEATDKTADWAAKIIEDSLNNKDLENALNMEFNGVSLKDILTNAKNKVKLTKEEAQQYSAALAVLRNIFLSQDFDLSDINSVLQVAADAGFQGELDLGDAGTIAVGYGVSLVKGKEDYEVNGQHFTDYDAALQAAALAAQIGKDAVFTEDKETGQVVTYKTIDTVDFVVSVDENGNVIYQTRDGQTFTSEKDAIHYAYEQYYDIWGDKTELEWAQEVGIDMSLYATSVTIDNEDELAKATSDQVSKLANALVSGTDKEIIDTAAEMGINVSTTGELTNADLQQIADLAGIERKTVALDLAADITGDYADVIKQILEDKTITANLNLNVSDNDKEILSTLAGFNQSNNQPTPHIAIADRKQQLIDDNLSEQLWMAKQRTASLTATPEDYAFDGGSTVNNVTSEAEQLVIELQQLRESIADGNTQDVSAYLQTLMSLRNNYGLDALSQQDQQNLFSLYDSTIQTSLRDTIVGIFDLITGNGNFSKAYSAYKAEQEKPEKVSTITEELTAATEDVIDELISTMNNAMARQQADARANLPRSKIGDFTEAGLTGSISFTTSTSENPVAESAEEVQQTAEETFSGVFNGLGLYIQDLYDRLTFDNEFTPEDFAIVSVLNDLNTELTDSTGIESAKESWNVDIAELMAKMTEGSASVIELGDASDSSQGYITNLAEQIDAIPDRSSIIKTLNGAISSLSSGGYAANSALSRVYSRLQEIATTDFKITIKTDVVGGSTTSEAKGNALARGRGTLMGELGPELWVSGGHYYVAGQNGAEFVDLPDDAIVFNHLQTKKLLGSGKGGRGTAVTNEKNAVARASGTTGPAMASAREALAQLKQIRAMWQAMLGATAKELGSMAGRGGSGGSSGGDGEKFSPELGDYERWYNWLRQIEKLEQQITLEEAKRENMRNGHAYGKSLQDEIDKLHKEIEVSQELSDKQKEFYELRRQEQAKSMFGQIFTYDKDGLMQYRENVVDDLLAKLNETDEHGNLTGAAESAVKQVSYLQDWIAAHPYKDENGNITTFDLSDLMIDPETGKKWKANNEEDAAKIMERFWDEFDGWIDELDGLYDSYNDKLKDIEDLIAKENELLQEYVDNQLELEDRIMKAIEAREQALIDTMNKEKDALAEASSAYITGLTDALNKERQMYDRNKDDQETTRLQRQLGILQRSGGSAAEIRSLQEQINDRLQDSYFDAQQAQIDAVKEASDLELERLEQQIEIAQETLDFYKEHGLFNEEMEAIMRGSDEEIISFITTYDQEWKGLSALAHDEQLRELTQMVQLWTEDRGKEMGWKEWRDAALQADETLTAGDLDKFHDVYGTTFKAALDSGDSPEVARAKATAAAEAELQKHKAKGTGETQQEETTTTTQTETETETKKFEPFIGYFDKSGSLSLYENKDGKNRLGYFGPGAGTGHSFKVLDYDPSTPDWAYIETGLAGKSGLFKGWAKIGAAQSILQSTRDRLHGKSGGGSSTGTGAAGTGGGTGVTSKPSTPTPKPESKPEGTGSGGASFLRTVAEQAISGQQTRDQLQDMYLQLAHQVTTPELLGQTYYTGNNQSFVINNPYFTIETNDVDGLYEGIANAFNSSTTYVKRR